jgi:NAD(P)H dehydrogenase (quinone)
MLRHLLRGTLYYTGMSVLPPFVAWHVPYISDEARREYLRAYKHVLNNLESCKPLSFPSLNDFDDKLYPLGIG